MVDSLQIRLFLTYVVTITVTVGLSAIVVYALLAEDRAAVTTDHLERLVVLAAADPATAGAVLSDDDVDLALLYEDGTIEPLAGSPAFEDLTVAADGVCSVDSGSGSEGPVCASAPIAGAEPGEAVAIVAVARPQSPLGLLGEATSKLLAAGLIGVAAAIILGFGLSRSVATPLRNIARAARSVGEGNFQHRVTVTGPAEVRALAETFNRMTEKVDVSQRTLRDFLINISHEIKTPLTSIRGFSGALLDGTIDDREGTERAMGVINHESDRLLRLVQELLDLSRLEAGQVTLRREPIDVPELLHHMREIFAFRAREAGLSLDIVVPEGLSVSADFDRLEQVLTNLMGNSVRHTPAGGHVVLAASEYGRGSVRISVSDSGPGIPSSELSRVFDRFYRSGTSADGKGHGLGLAICREIVRALGGEITAESAPGQGTTFSFTLPSAAPAAPRAAVLSH